MIKLSILLIGRRSFGGNWITPFWAGVILVILAFALVVPHAAWLTVLATKAFGFVILFRGAVGLLAVAHHIRTRVFQSSVKSAIFTGFGVLLLVTPVDEQSILSWFLAAGLVIDGLSRILLIALVRFEQWYQGVLTGACELLLAAIIVSDWPLPPSMHIPLCMALLVANAGMTLLRFAFFLRRSPTTASIHASRLLEGRNWNENAPAWNEGEIRGRDGKSAMRVFIWTPTGAANLPTRFPLIDRYLMAFDDTGKPSTGHASIEASSDLYISHWPVEEIRAGIRELPHVFFAGEKNDVEGMFPPSYAWECADWIPATEMIEFTCFDEKRLRAYWQAYSLSSNYNVTNRNCSIVVAGGLETALEGSLAGPRPLLRLFMLLFTPAVWQAAYLRSRAEHMCWTPGMVLDYARALHRIVHPEHADAAFRASPVGQERLAL